MRHGFPGRPHTPTRVYGDDGRLLGMACSCGRLFTVRGNPFTQYVGWRESGAWRRLVERNRLLRKLAKARRMRR